MRSTRRTLLQATPVFLLAGASACSRDAEPERPDGVPLGPFGAESTAEDVTSGLDLSGKTAVVTGCNSGIGYETMRVLALRGAHVIGTARTQEKGREACNSVSGRATPVVLELTDFQSVVQCAEDIRKLANSIDILICNAGVMELPELEQVYGIEKQFAVNHLGHFLLVQHLLPHVMAAPQGRIVNVSSGRATGNAPAEGIQFDNLSGEAGYDPGKAYGQSKLANILFTLELADRLRDSQATANAIRPGVIPTNLGRHMPRWQVIALETVGKLFTKTIPQGAATTCYVATAPALANSSGYFFEDCNPIRAGGYSEDRQMAARLWQVSEQLTADYLPG